MGQGGGSRGTEKLSYSRYILKIKETGFAENGKEGEVKCD